MPEIRPVVKTIAPVVAAGIPSFIVGDFNAPSHLDWTRETVGLLPQIRFPVRWPVSMLLGRRASTIRIAPRTPNPVAAWARPGRPDDRGPPTAGTPAGRAARPHRPDLGRGRRDHGARARSSVSAAATMSPSRSLRGARTTAGSSPRWSSRPAAVAGDGLVRSARLVTKGRDLTVTYHAPGDPGEKVVIVPAGGDPATDAIDQTPTPAADDVDGSVTFATGAWAPGRVRRRARRRRGRRAVARRVLGRDFPAPLRRSTPRRGATTWASRSRVSW